jgi:amidase
MQRRGFLKTSSLAGIGLTTLAAGSATLLTAARQADQKSRHDEKDDFVLNEMTIDQLQQKMQSGEYSSKSITGLYLKRIEEIDKNGPSSIR